MNIKTKRIIASMILSVSLSCAVTSGVLLYNHTNNYNALNKELEAKQTFLYNKLKNDPDYLNAYQSYISKLQSDFLSGKITAQQYDSKLSELNTANTFMREYSQTPEVQEEYANEVAEINDIEERIKVDSKKFEIPCIATGLVGTLGLSTGSTILMSTIEGEIEDKLGL